MKAIKKYGINSYGFPQDYIQEILIVNDNDIVPNGYTLASEEEINQNLSEYQDEVNLLIEEQQEQERLNSTYRFNQSQSIDTNVDYRIQSFIKKEVGLEGESTIVTEYYESVDENNTYQNLVIREEKEYQKLNSSPLFNYETLRVKYYNLNNDVLYTKTVETPLSLGYSMSISARMMELKIIKAEEYIVSQIGLALGLPIHISLLNEIKQYERMDVMPLYNAINNPNFTSLTNEQKATVNSILFGA